MTGQELATAVQYDAPIVVLVVDNGMYGTIRMHQERALPGARQRHRPAQPGLRRPRAAFGGHGERVERTEELPEALERALALRAARRSLHLLVDPEAITPRRTLTEIREQPGSEAPRSRDSLPRPGDDDDVRAATPLPCSPGPRPRRRSFTPPGPSLTTWQVSTRFKQATGDKLVSEPKGVLPGALRRPRSRGGDDREEGPLRDVHGLRRHRSPTSRHEVTDLLADGHTGVLGTPGAGNIYWEPGRTIYGDRFWLAKRRYGAQRRRLVVRLHRRAEDGRDASAGSTRP